MKTMEVENIMSPDDVKTDAKDFTSQHETRTSMKAMEVKGFASPDEVRTFPKGKLELIKVGNVMIGKATFEPGWKWSSHVRPLVKTRSCEAPHFQYHISGTLHVVTDSGETRDVKAGEISALGSGHDAWVVGNEPVVVIDFQGMRDYAKPMRTEK